MGGAAFASGCYEVTGHRRLSYSQVTSGQYVRFLICPGATRRAGSAKLSEEIPMPKYAANVPASIKTPDTVQTRIGTLKFFDGLPDAQTVQRVYDNLDFSRGVETFLTCIPAASVFALCDGMRHVGIDPNRGLGKPR
jgi:hypothetical protein